MTTLKTLRVEVKRILKASGCTIGLIDEVDSEFEGFEKKFKDFDADKWFDENVYENWTWEGMLKKFIEKEILGYEL